MIYLDSKYKKYEECFNNTDANLFLINFEDNYNLELLLHDENKKVIFLLNEQYESNNFEYLRLINARLLISDTLQEEFLIKNNYNNFEFINFKLTNNNKLFGNLQNKNKTNYIHECAIGFNLDHEEIQILNIFNIPVISNYKYKNCLEYTDSLKINDFRININDKNKLEYFIDTVCNKNKKFSIITPNYNTRRFIDKNIESIRNQLYTNYEHLIIDDDSNDGSYEYLIEKYSNDSKIILFKNKQNSGTYFCRNTGLKNMSNTDYFVVLDSDDYFTNKRLILDLYFLFDNNCINSISNRIYENDKIIKIYNTYSPTFHISVFKNIGYFWNVRVAADSEYIKRYISYYKNKLLFII
jgi:hypothetical protein